MFCSFCDIHKCLSRGLLNFLYLAFLSDSATLDFKKVLSILGPRHIHTLRFNRHYEPTLTICSFRANNCRRHQHWNYTFVWNRCAEGMLPRRRWIVHWRCMLSLHGKLWGCRASWWHRKLPVVSGILGSEHCYARSECVSVDCARWVVKKSFRNGSFRPFVLRNDLVVRHSCIGRFYLCSACLIISVRNRGTFEKLPHVFEICERRFGLNNELTVEGVWRL